MTLSTASLHGRPLALSPCQIEGDVKERTLMFEKTRGSFPGDVVYLSRIIHIMGCGWVTESS